MIPIFKKRGKLSKKRMSLFTAIITTILVTGVVYAQVGALTIYTKPGDPTELSADGKSQTRLLFDLSGCAWYPTAGAKDLLQIEFTSSLGTSLSPPSVFETVGKVGSPFELTLKAGTQYGTAKVTASASYCTEGNIMVLGTCSSQLEQNNPKCTGEFEILIRPADSESEEGESQEESEEQGDLSVSITCPNNPKAGTSVTCTASVSGAGQDESLEYLWSLDGVAGSRSKKNTYTWTGAESGYYEVSVEVFGKDRSVNKTLRVNVLDSDSSDESEKTDESTSSGSNDVSNLVSNLESFLRAAGVKNISPAKLAVAGTGVSALIAVWMITQHRSGIPMEKLEQALGQWRWREGQKVPKPSSEGGKKPPEKLPEKTPGKAPQTLPEGLKSDKPHEGQVSLPEEKPAGEGAKASASAQFSEPDPAAASPPPGKAVSGETLEKRAERSVDDAEDLRDAVDKTMAGLKKKVEGVPKPIKDSEFWKQKVAPKLKKLDELGIESKSGKLKEFLRITKDLLEVRKKVDANLSFLSKKDREGIVYLERVLQGGEEVIKKAHQQFVTDPAIAAAKWGLPKEQAAAAEKILKQHQSDIEKMLKGIKKLPRKLAENQFKASQRHQAPDINKDLHEGIRHNTPTKFHKGLDKIKPAIKKVRDARSALKKWLGKHLVYFKEIPPAPD